MQAGRHSLLALALAVACAPLGAQDAPQPLEIHGFGAWVYGRTNQNNYLAGTPDGDYRSTLGGLTLSKQLDAKLSIHVQADLETRETTDAALDFAFADYRLNDGLSFHIGRVKHPFGIYAEVFDVGTLRPFIDLPQAVYGPVGLVGESYTGIGLTGNTDLGNWAVTYDVYGGGHDIAKLAVPEQYFRGSALQSVSEEIETQSTRNVVGGRVVFQAPIRGLTFGGSSYTGTLNEPSADRRTVVAGQVGYRTNALTVESEIAHEDQVHDEKATGGYALVAYRLTAEWQVGAQFDDLVNSF